MVKIILFSARRATIRRGGSARADGRQAPAGNLYRKLRAYGIAVERDEP